MVKEIIKKVTIVIISSIALCASTVHAATTNIDFLLPLGGGGTGIYDLSDPSNKGKNQELNAVANLPDITVEEALATGIKTILFWSMLLTLIAIIIAAIYYLISRGKEEDLTKAKNIILYLIIGIAIMAAAYGVVSGIAQFKFFENLPTTGDENPS